MKLFAMHLCIFGNKTIKALTDISIKKRVKTKNGRQCNTQKIGYQKHLPYDWLRDMGKAQRKQTSIASTWSIRDRLNLMCR